MTIDQTHRLMSAANFTRELLAGKPLRHVHVMDELDLFQDHAHCLPVSIENVQINHLQAGLTFEAPITFTDSTFNHVGLYSCFFIAGLRITNWQFHTHFDCTWGGHNKRGPILIENTTFKCFANFHDEWFMGPVILKNVRFEAGTNLLAQGEPHTIRFDVPPLLENVTGNLQIQNAPAAPQ